MKTRIALLSVFLAATLQATSFSTLPAALKQVLPAGQKTFKAKLVVDAAQAKALNSFGHGDFLEDDEFDVFYTKDASGKVSGVAVHLSEYLVRWKSSHSWVVGLTPDGRLTGVAVVELSDKYAAPLADAAFLKQFAGKTPTQVGYGKGMDAVAGASESCQLLSSSLQRAAWIATHTPTP